MNIKKSDNYSKIRHKKVIKLAKKSTNIEYYNTISIIHKILKIR